MKTPNITTAQVAAAAGALLGVLVVLFKLDLSGTDQAEIVAAIVTLWAVGQQIADAIIRHGRAGIVIAQHQRATAELQAAILDHVDLPDPPKTVKV